MRLGAALAELAGIIGEERVGEHGDMAEHLVKEVGFLQIIHLVRLADEGGHREFAIGEHVKKRLRRHQTRYPDHLPAGELHQFFIHPVEMRNARLVVEIKRFDEFGELLLDFNRMAEAIERLVSRVQASETARNNLLQELGHDVRTPLTSLTTSFESMKAHSAKLSEAERNDLFEMMGAEVEYLRDLLDQLMTIATLHEPNYRSSTQFIDLNELLGLEVHRRLGSSVIKWQFIAADTPTIILGDAHLVQRLVRNAFDNAARFASRTITVTLSKESKTGVIEIHDDGPGLSAAALSSFGKRQERRTRRDDQRLNFSLGLGSVIMKVIADLHHGSVDIRNIASQSGIQGAALTIRIPLVASEEKSSK